MFRFFSTLLTKFLVFTLLFLFTNCAGLSSDTQDSFTEPIGKNYESSPDDSLDEKKLKVYLKQQKETIQNLEEMVETLDKKIEKHNDSYTNLFEKLDSLKSSIEQKNEVDTVQEPQIDVLNTIIKLKNKIKILEDRAFYTDSLYFEIVNDLVQIENKIISLTSSYKEMIQLKTSGAIKELPSISDEEYTARYIESLSAYQNGEWNKSLEGFTYLIAVNSSHDLADNCQYWVGEVYYALKNYKRSIKEFENVFSFPGTNKADDSQYKLGLCYLNISNNQRALEEFRKVIDYYPNSEYYKKSQQYVKQLQ